MDTTESLILETADRIFREQVTPELREQAAAGMFPTALWTTLEAQGLLAVADADVGLPAALTFDLLKLAGRFAVPVPLAESLLAARWLSSKGAEKGVDEGADTDIEKGFERVTIGIGRATTPTFVPWGRFATAALRVPRPVPGDSAGVTQPVELLAIETFTPVDAALLLEPGDYVDGPVLRTLAVPDAGSEMALARAALMSGALETVLELTLRYASEREQFGRPLARFQAIQHQIAVLAAEVAAAQMATASAIDAFGASDWPVLAAVAKIRTGEAAGVAVEIAHQVHGAMGFTREHELHQFTMRLLRWRDECGHEAEWQRWLGDQVLLQGASNCWAFIAAAGAAADTEQSNDSAMENQAL